MVSLALSKDLIFFYQRVHSKGGATKGGAFSVEGQGVLAVGRHTPWGAGRLGPGQQIFLKIGSFQARLSAGGAGWGQQKIQPQRGGSTTLPSCLPKAHPRASQCQGSGIPLKERRAGGRTTRREACPQNWPSR